MMIDQICIGILGAVVMLGVIELIASLLQKPYLLSSIAYAIIKSREKYYTKKYENKLLYDVQRDMFTYSSAVFYDKEADYYRICGTTINIEHLLILPYQYQASDSHCSLSQRKIKHNDIVVVYSYEEGVLWYKKSNYHHALLRYLPDQSNDDVIKLFDVNTNDIYVYNRTLFVSFFKVIDNIEVQLHHPHFMYVSKPEEVLPPKQQYVVKKKKKTTEI